MIKLAIHHREGSFSDRWIEYCEKHTVDYIIVDCYNNKIIEILKKENVTHLMWHFHHSSSHDILISSYVFNAVEAMGIKTFPDYNTYWHFDDKCAQKYIFEALGVFHPKTYIYYDKKAAINKLDDLNFPIVSKLKGGAGSSNVKLLKSKSEALDNINIMFDVGIATNSSVTKNLSNKVKLAKNFKNPFHLAKKVVGYRKKVKKENSLNKIEIGYVYWQEFMPNNKFDTRIIVIGDKAFGIRRFTKPDDFRASGSGLIDYNHQEIDHQFIKLAFSISQSLGFQCMAYDFVYDQNNDPVVIEMSYGFAMKAYDKCEGFWDDTLKFHKGQFNPQFMMMNLFLSE